MTGNDRGEGGGGGAHGRSITAARPSPPPGGK